MKITTLQNRIDQQEVLKIMLPEDDSRIQHFNNSIVQISNKVDMQRRKRSAQPLSLNSRLRNYAHPSSLSAAPFISSIVSTA